MALLTFCSAQAQTQKYAINIQTITNGTVEADKTEAAIGETVTLTVTPDAGYEVDVVTVVAGYEVQGGGGNPRAPQRKNAPRKAAMWIGQGNVTVTKSDDTHYQFTLPESFSSTLTPNYTNNTEFKVTATFKEVEVKKYAITVIENEDGTIETDVDKAAIGETVTITVTPDEGFMVDEVTVTAGYEPTEGGSSEADAPARRAPRKAGAWVSQGLIEVTKVDDITYTFTLPESLPGPLPTEYTDNTEFKVSATFKELVILANKADNTSVIDNYALKNVSVKLADRTLTGNGIWNTFCVPFNLDITGSILDGADVRKLTSSNYSKGVLEITFETVDEIEAGVPYIVRWTEGDGLTEPVFEDVEIVGNATTPTATDYITFNGTYAPVTFENEDRTVLFLGTDNKLYYPDGVEPTNINSQRGYFKLADGYEMKGSSSVDPDGVKFRINIEENDTPTSITDILNSSEEGLWFDIAGRKVNGKPATKGIYINNGHKFIIK